MLVTVCVITLTYTMLAGLPASVITDRLQGVMITGFMLLFTVILLADNRVTKAQYERASKSTDEGFVVMITLIIAVLSAELFNAGQWQRVYAAKSTADLRKGLALGAGLIFFVMWFFGVLGVVSLAKYYDDYEVSYTKYAYLGFFYLAESLNKGWHVLILIFATSLCVSSVDSIQNGLTSVLYRDVLNFGVPVNVIRVVCAALNVGAIFVAIDKIDVLSLFLMVDLVCALGAPALYLGLMREDMNSFIVAPTELGAIMGVVSVPLLSSYKAPFSIWTALGLIATVAYTPRRRSLSPQTNGARQLRHRCTALGVRSETFGFRTAPPSKAVDCKRSAASALLSLSSSPSFSLRLAPFSSTGSTSTSEANERDNH